MKYVVHFLYNSRGRAAVETIAHCELPEGLGVVSASKGFWVDDKGIYTNHEFGYWVKYMPTSLDATFWVPPWRITGIEKRPMGPIK